MARPHPIAIHLVRSTEPPKPKPELDPSTIVDEVLTTVRESRVALTECEEYMDMIRGELASRLNQLEVSALRSMAAKVRRS